MDKRVKYDYKFKRTIVLEVIKKGLSCYSVGNKHGLRKSLVQKWVRFYKAHGAKGLRPIRNKYSEKFKARVVLEMKEKSLSYQETCVLFKIPTEETFKRWLKIYEEKGPEGLSIEKRAKPKSMPRKPKKPMTREEQLLDELADLKAENAYLKKLHALVQSEKEKEEKRKSSRN